MGAWAEKLRERLRGHADERLAEIAAARAAERAREQARLAAEQAERSVGEGARARAGRGRRGGRAAEARERVNVLNRAAEAGAFHHHEAPYFAAYRDNTPGVHERRKAARKAYWSGLRAQAAEILDCAVADLPEAYWSKTKGHVAFRKRS